MNEMFKRVLALLLTLCMVVPMLPVSSFAVAVEDPEFTQGDPDAVPEPVEKAVWVQTEWEYICGYDYEHTHVSPVAENDCYDNSNCSHNHTDDCYNKELVLCMHEAGGTYNGEHIDSKPGSELTNGEKAGCADYQSAYQTAYEAAKSDPEYQKVYDDTVAQAVADMKASEEYKKAYDRAYRLAFDTPSNILFSNPAYQDEDKSRAVAEEACAYLLQGLGKAGAELAQVSYCDTKGKAAAENGQIYCYKNTTLKCDHAAGCPYPGDCWVESCGKTEHTHSDACKRWTWILKADANTNGTPDEEEPKYTVSFDLNGGTGSAESQSVLVGLKAEQVTDPTRTYYTFAGWFYTVVENEVEVEKQFSFETEIAQDYALKAKWSPVADADGDGVANEEETQYTVVYKSGYGENEILDTHSNKVEGENTPRVAKEDEPKRAGYNFAGWTPAVADKLDTAIAVNGVITYTAQWNQLCNVFFMLDENTQYDETVSVEKNSTVPAPENAPAKDYYNFLGWYEKNADTSFDFTKKITENVHLYAKWSVKSDCDDNANGIADAEEVKYVITYTDGMENVELFPDQVTEVLPGMPTPAYETNSSTITTPVVNGYKFLKWDADVAENVPSEAATEETKRITYKAVWAVDTNNNGVDDEEETLTITAVGEGKGTVTVNGEEKPAYVYDSANGEKIVIAAKPADGSYVAAITNNGEAVTLDESKFAERTYTYELVIGQPVMTTADDETAEPKKGHAVSVTFAEAKFTLKDSPYLPVKEEKVYTEEELYTSAITAPAYDEAKVEVKGYLARPKTTLSAYVKEFEVFGQTYGGKTYTFDLPEIWESDLTAVYEYTDPQILVDNTVKTIEDNISKGTIDGYLAAAKALSNLQNLNLGSLGCHSFGYDDGVKFGGKEIIRVTYTSNAVVIDDPQVPVWTKDERQTTTLTIADQTFTYDPNLTSAALLSKLEKNTNAQGGEYTLLENMDGADVGEYTITVKYSGSTTHKPTTATAKVTITPAPAAVNVPFNYVRYGEAYSKPVITSGENDVTASVDHVTIIAGLDLANKATFVQMILPEMLQQMVNNMGLSFTVGDILDGLSALSDALDADKLNQIKAAVAEVPGIEEIANTQVIVGGNYPANTGTYLIGVVTADTNYETAYGLNMLVIHPDGAKLDLAWIEDDSNGLYTLEALKSGKHDLGAEITTVYETIEGVDPADYLDVMFVGVDVNEGAGIITDVNDLTIGTYTEIAYMRDLGNQMYYAEPLVRQVTVISDLVSVEFVDANDNNIRTFENDGNPHAMEAVATHRDGIALDQNNLTYRIYGMESDGDLYEGTFSHAEILSGNVGPKNTGTYTVIATYRDSAIPEYIGIGVGALIINPKPAAISVNDMIRPYEDSRSDSLMSLIQKDPADAKMAVMVAGITNIGDFSEDGLAAVEGTVYIDLPQRVEDAINTVKGNELVTVDNFKALLAPLAGALEATGMDISAVQAFYDELAALPGTLNVQIADLTDYQFNKIGAYVVVAGIMDNDYYPAVDSGLVVIHPEIEEYTLGWNHADTNGILTRISLDSKVDLKASAQNAEGALVEDAAIKYLVYGFEKDGAEVKLTGTDEDIEGKIHALRDGVYTQVAYIETEIDAEMVIAMAINRQLILMTESVIVDAPNQEYVYGDEIDYVSKITVKDPYNNHEFTAEELAENLTVKFAGINGTEIGYYSEEVPSDAGSYAVFAQYKQEENGDIKYFGIGLGTLTIKPAALGYDIVDSYHKYDGTQKAPEVKKPVTGIHDVLFIVDTQNASVNVIAPSLGQDSDNWDGDLHIQYWLDELNTILANQNINKDELISKLDALISKLAELGIVEENVLDSLLAVVKQIDSDLLTLNKALPVGKEKSVCKYNVYGIAFKDMNHAIEVAEGVLTIGDGYPIYFQSGDANGVIQPGATVFVDDVAYVLDENCVAWADDKNRELAVGYVYRNSGNHTTDHAYSDTTKNMYIWDLQWNEETNSYKADRVEELDNLLSFAGGSIWLGSNGVNGIRTYYATTADTEAVKGAFRNLGYEVVSHGVVVGWADKLNGSEPVPNGNNSAAGHAAGSGTFYDEIYPAADKYITPDLRARFYVELRNIETSETKIIYSGSVERSIGYIAYQNIDIVAAQYQPYVKAILDKAAAAGFTYGGK